MGKYEAAQKTGLRGIYQLVDLYQDELITMMRGYDMTQTFDLRKKRSMSSQRDLSTIKSKLSAV